MRKRAQLLVHQPHAVNEACKDATCLPYRVLTIHFLLNISISDLVIPPLRSKRAGTMWESKLSAKF